MSTLEKFVLSASKALASEIKALKTSLFDPLIARVAALESSKSEPGPAGERGEKGEIGPAGPAGVPGEKGERGEHAVSFDDFDLRLDGRTLIFKFCGKSISGKTLEKSVSITLPYPMDAGVYRIDKTYENGDVVTHDGSMWIAQCDTASRPGTDKTWRLCVKRGRDGKDGARGEKGEPGRPGRDLTQIGPDGAKW